LTATSYPDVPAGIEPLLRRALAKTPDQRHASMALLAADLSALATEPARDRSAGEIDAAARMSATERRRAAVLVTVVSDYPSLVDQMTQSRRSADRPAPDGVDVVRGALARQSPSAKRSPPSFGCRSPTTRRPARGARGAGPAPPRRRRRADCPPGSACECSRDCTSGPWSRRLQEGPRRYDIVGAPTALAARLAALADADEVWLSPETQRLWSACTRRPARRSLDSQVGPVIPFRVASPIASRLGRRAERD
jgi:hypothetical protein